MIAGSKARVYFTVLGYDGEPGRLRRIQMFTVQEEWSIWKLGRVLHLGAEVHRVVATKGETLDNFVLPKLPGGDYLLIASYESARERLSMASRWRSESEGCGGRTWAV